MSRQGYNLAKKVAKSRPTHNTLQEAELFYFDYRNSVLKDVKKINKSELDCSSESLKILEGLYFEYLEEENNTIFIAQSILFQDWLRPSPKG